VGRSLKFDGAKEKFSGDKEADALLTRTCQKPCVVPTLAQVRINTLRLGIYRPINFGTPRPACSI
jgi:hypothetical protein